MSNIYEELIEKGAKAWNNWRALNPGTITLENITFTGNPHSLSAYWYEYGNQSGDCRTINFENVIIKNSKFILADFSSADFKNAVFDQCLFSGCHFYKVNLQNTLFKNVEFQTYLKDSKRHECKAGHVDISSCIFFNVRAEIGALQYMDICMADLKGLQGTVQSLTNVNAKDFQFDNVEFAINVYKCRLNNLNFNNSVLSVTSFASEFTDIHLVNCHISQLGLEFLTLATLNRVKFHNSNLNGLAIQDTRISDSSFNQSKLDIVKYDSVVLENCDFDATFFYSNEFRNSALINSRRLGQVVAANKNYIDLYTLSHSSPFPARFLESFGLDVQSLKKFATESNILRIEFSQHIWPHLIPMEIVLTYHFGNNYKIIKGASTISVEFFTPEDLQKALDVLLPIITSFEKNFPDNLSNIGMSAKNRDEEILNNKEIKELLGFLLVRFEMQFPMDKRKTDVVDETILESVKAIPIAGGLFALWLQKWIESDKLPPEEIQKAVIETYKKFNRYFEGTKGLVDPGADIPKLTRGK